MALQVPLSEDDVSQLVDTLCWAFNLSEREHVRIWIERGRPENFRILREDGRVAAGLVRIRMGQYFGGRSVSMEGIAGVAVDPACRGRGLAQRLMRGVVEEMRADGLLLSALYPATRSLYRKSGYEQAGSRFEVTVPLSRMRMEKGDLAVREIGDADTPRLRAAYVRYAHTRNGMLDRGEYIWSRIVRPYPPALLRGFVAEDARGDVQGYLYAILRSAEHGYNLALSDFVALTPQAGRSLLGFLREHGTLGREASWFASPTDPLLMLLPEPPRKLRAHTGWMLRLLDVPGALAARGYPAGVRCALHLEVADEMLPENAGRWVLTVEDGRGSVRRGGRGSLRLHVRGLAALYTGFLAPEDMRRAGLLEGTEKAAAGAAAAFAGPLPFMPDMF